MPNATLFAPSARAAHPGWTAIVLGVAMSAASPAPAQVLEAGFAPSFNDSVYALAVQADGRILVGGQFSSAGGVPRSGLARLATNGSVEAALAVPDDRVRAIGVQADGRIVIGGEFDSVGATPRVGVARLLADGTLDTGFVPQVGVSALGVTHLAVQTDGRVVIAGGFTTVSGQARDGIVRLNADGSLDTSFSPPAQVGTIEAMLVQPDGAVVIAGDLSDVTPDCPSYCVLRLSAGGARDSAFAATQVIGVVRHLARQADGKTLVAGEFGGLGTHLTYFVGRLGSNGAPDLGFVQTALRYSDITRIVPLADGRMIIGGEIRWGTTGPTVDRIARLEANGARDTTFTEPALDSMIITTALQPDNRLLVGGMFTQFAGQPRVRLARLTLGAPLDPVYANGFD